MTHISTSIILAGLLLGLPCFSLETDVRSIDQALTTAFTTMTSADYQLRFDSLSLSFKKQLIQQLTNPVTFTNSLDSLSTRINVVTSPDKNIKFYSWDDLTGGTWHTIHCLAQFPSDDGKIIVQQLSGEETDDDVDFTDSGIYEVHEIVIKNKKFYLTFAWGTHGAGHQHSIAQVFSITSGNLQKCTSCFAGSKDLIVEYPRSVNAGLAFHPRTKTITYNEFLRDKNDGFFRATGRVMTLKLENGVFRKP